MNTSPYIDRPLRRPPSYRSRYVARVPVRYEEPGKALPVWMLFVVAFWAGIIVAGIIIAVT